MIQKIISLEEFIKLKECELEVLQTKIDGYHDKELRAPEKLMLKFKELSFHIETLKLEL